MILRKCNKRTGTILHDNPIHFRLMSYVPENAPDISLDGSFELDSEYIL